MSEWDARWMAMATLVATWSKDRSRKVGCVIVDYRQVVVSLGWNGFPRGVEDDVDERHDRPAKYLWTEHAERNAIYNAASTGIKLKGTRLYCNLYPCADCARAIIQSGINLVIVRTQPKWNDVTYRDSFAVTKEMLKEAKVVVKFLEDT
jgi:dCMP deaminase